MWGSRALYRFFSTTHPHACGEYASQTVNLSQPPHSTHPHACGEYGGLTVTYTRWLSDPPPRMWGIHIQPTGFQPIQAMYVTVRAHLAHNTGDLGKAATVA